MKTRARQISCGPGIWIPCLLIAIALPGSADLPPDDADRDGPAAAWKLSFDELERALETLWGEPLSPAPDYRRADARDMALVVPDILPPWHCEEGFAVFESFLQLVDLIEPDRQFRQVWEASAAARPDVVYDLANHEVLIRKGLDLDTEEAQIQVARAIARVLLYQETDRRGWHFMRFLWSSGEFSKPGFELALIGGAMADGLGEILAEAAVNGPITTREATGGRQLRHADAELPEWIIGMHGFIHRESLEWWRRLARERGFGALRESWGESRFPQSTAELAGLAPVHFGAAFHERVLGLSPAEGSLPEDDRIVRAHYPCIIGRWIFRELIRRRLGDDEAVEAATGWIADVGHLSRMADGGVLVYWQIAWQDEEIAERRAALIEETLAGIPRVARSRVALPPTGMIPNNATFVTILLSPGG